VLGSVTSATEFFPLRQWPDGSPGRGLDHPQAAKFNSLAIGPRVNSTEIRDGDVINQIAIGQIGAFHVFFVPRQKFLRVLQQGRKRAGQAWRTGHRWARE